MEDSLDSDTFMRKKFPEPTVELKDFNMKPETELASYKNTKCIQKDTQSTEMNAPVCEQRPLERTRSNVNHTCLKKLVTVPAFVGFYSFACIFKEALRHYIISQVPTIEKRFGLKSSLSGMLISLNEIGYLGICLFITPLAPYVHIPKTIFAAFVLVGVSGILSGLPHFVNRAAGNIPDLSTGIMSNTSISRSRHQEVQLCTSLNNSTHTDNMCSDVLKSVDDDVVDTSIRTMFLILFGTGMALQGIAKSIHWPFLTVYMDNGRNRRKTGFYIGIIIGCKIMGPMLAFLFGSLFSRLYLTLEAVDITHKDPRWVGAWWLGFVLFGIASCIFAAPLSFYPRSLEGENASTLMVNGTSVKCLSTKEKIKERSMSYWRVLTIPEFVCLLCHFALHLASIEGHFSFISKYVQTQFNLPLWKANIIPALSDVLPACLGTFLGGILTRKIKLTPRKTMGLMIFFISCHSLFASSGYFFGCSQPSIVGPKSIHGVRPNNYTECSTGCYCKAEKYFPICGSDGISYHSPCFAGCERSFHNKQAFSNCTCIPDGKATVGLCDSGCNTLIPFCISCVLSSLADTMAISPGFVAQLRSVESRDKPTAVGLLAFFGSLAGFLPAPIIYGKVVDSACLLWQGSCSDNQGACLMYDIEDFRTKIFGLSASLKVTSIVSLIFALLFVRKYKHWHQDLEENKREMVNISCTNLDENLTCI